MRETTKEVIHEVDGEKMVFKIRKMDALRGSYLLKFATEKIIPIFTCLEDVFAPISDKDDKDKIIKARTEKVMRMIPDLLSKLTEDELIYLETRCLQYVDVKLPAGDQPAMVGNNFGVEALETDIMTVLILCYEVMQFNLGSFLAGKNLGSILSRLGISQPTA